MMLEITDRLLAFAESVRQRPDDRTSHIFADWLRDETDAITEDVIRLYALPPREQGKDIGTSLLGRPVKVAENLYPERDDSLQPLLVAWTRYVMGDLKRATLVNVANNKREALALYGEFRVPVERICENVNFGHRGTVIVDGVVVTGSDFKVTVQDDGRHKASWVGKPVDLIRPERSSPFASGAIACGQISMGAIVDGGYFDNISSGQLYQGISLRSGDLVNVESGGFIRHRRNSL